MCTESATVDEDYIDIHENLTMDAGDSKCYELEIVDDMEIEGNETVIVGLWDVLATGSFYDLVTIVIIDNDGMC